MAMHFVKKKIQSAFMLGVNAFWIGKKINLCFEGTSMFVVVYIETINSF